MEQRTMIKRKWFWSWQDHKEEAWLQEMSQEGWHLKSKRLSAYEFEKGEPRNFVYRLDFRMEKDKDFEEYLSLCEEAGWEYMGMFGTWRYFRQEVAEGETVELFTDSESKISKYQQILALYIVFTPAFMIGLIASMDQQPIWLRLAVTTVFLAWVMVFIMSFIKIMQRIKQLRKLP